MIDEDVDESEGKVTDITLVVGQAKKRVFSPAQRFKWINPWCILQKSPLRRTAWPGGWSGRMSWCGGDGPSQKIRMLEKSFRFRKVIKYCQRQTRPKLWAMGLFCLCQCASCILYDSLLHLNTLEGSAVAQEQVVKRWQVRHVGFDIAELRFVEVLKNNRWIVLIMIIDEWPIERVVAR